MKHYVILDLEATCWKQGMPRAKMETIEFGSVKLNLETLQVEDEFAMFVRPTLEPELSDFCKELTAIRQQDVDNAALFPEVLNKFVNWFGDKENMLCTWGDYDVGQIKMKIFRNLYCFCYLIFSEFNKSRIRITEIFDYHYYISIPFGIILQMWKLSL